MHRLIQSREKAQAQWQAFTDKMKETYLKEKQRFVKDGQRLDTAIQAAIAEQDKARQAVRETVAGAPPQEVAETAPEEMAWEQTKSTWEQEDGSGMDGVLHRAMGGPAGGSQHGRAAAAEPGDSTNVGAGGCCGDASRCGCGHACRGAATSWLCARTRGRADVAFGMTRPPRRGPDGPRRPPAGPRPETCSETQRHIATGQGPPTPEPLSFGPPMGPTGGVPYGAASPSGLPVPPTRPTGDRSPGVDALNMLGRCVIPFYVTLLSLVTLSLWQALCSKVPGKDTPLGRLLVLPCQGLPTALPLPLGSIGAIGGGTCGGYSLGWAPWADRKGRACKTASIARLAPEPSLTTLSFHVATRV